MAMTAPDENTYIPIGAGGTTLEEEEVRDVIEQITPEETPFYSDASKGTVRSINPEWGTINVGTITKAPAEPRGFKAALLPSIVPTRLGNRVQLTAETGSVADSYDALDVYGRDDESDYQMLLKGILLRRRVNALMHANQAFTTVEPTEMATLINYINGARFVSVATTPGVPGAGDGSTAFTPGTGAVAFDSIDPIDDMMEACYATEGQPQVLYMSPAMKRKWSRLPDASVAENRINMTAGTSRPFNYVGTVDIYLSDFGRLEVAVDRDALPTVILGVDPGMVEVATLPGRAFKRTNLAKVGSSTDFMMEWEGTVRVWNPTAHGAVEGLNATL